MAGIMALHRAALHLPNRIHSATKPHVTFEISGKNEATHKSACVQLARLGPMDLIDKRPLIGVKQTRRRCVFTAYYDRYPTLSLCIAT
jgi:hypothetical protein